MLSERFKNMRANMGLMEASDPPTQQELFAVLEVLHETMDAVADVDARLKKFEQRYEQLGGV